ncbi:MAG: hypothetical protein F4029_06250 [Gammaproteobacteria bacterium]|nr:hypothetical protein [Gammaproteobacteria bacterium]MYK45812.1 hypothetical protein [Gammaproteobacteria bacterium]
MRAYFEFAGRTGTLAVTLAATAVLLVLVFPNLPIDGELLDLKPGYSHDEAMASMEQYGPNGRTMYAWASVLIDTLFPVCYVTLFAGLIYRFRLTEGTWILAFLPVAAGIWDLAENAQITAMLLQYPDVGATQVAWASTFTAVKGWMGPIYQTLGVGLLAVQAARAAIRAIRRRVGS